MRVYLAGRGSPLGTQLWKEALRTAAWPCAGGGGGEPAKSACSSGNHTWSMETPRDLDLDSRGTENVGEGSVCLTPHSCF